MGSNLSIFSSQSIVLKRKGIHSSLWKDSELKRLFWKYFLSELSQAGFLLGLRVFLCGSKFSTSSRCFLQKKVRNRIIKGIYMSVALKSQLYCLLLSPFGSPADFPHIRLHFLPSLKSPGFQKCLPHFHTLEKQEECFLITWHHASVRKCPQKERFVTESGLCPFGLGKSCGCSHGLIAKLFIRCLKHR